MRKHGENSDNNFESLKLKYEKVLKAIPDLFFIFDKDGYLRDYYTNNTNTILPYEKLINKNIKEFLPPKAVTSILKNIAAVLKENKPFTIRFYIPPQKIYHEMRLISYSKDRVLAIVRDITEQEIIRLELKESEELYHKMFEHSPDPIIIYSEGKVVEANREACKFVQVKDCSELIGKNVLDFVHPDSIEFARKRIEKMLKTKKSSELAEEKFITAKGEVRNVEVSSVPIVHKNKLSVLVTFRDITERKKAEKKLIESEQKYRELYSILRLTSDSIQDMIWAKDMNKKFIFANKAICERLLSAKDTEEPLGKTDLFFAERERKKHPENPNWHTFGEICQDSDEVIIKTKKPARFDEFGNVKGKYLFLDVFKAPLLDETGKMIGIVGSARDMTEEKKKEKKQKDLLEKLSRQAEYLKVIDEASTLLLTTDDYEKSIEKIIEMLGMVTHSNRVYIFENSEDKETGEHLMNRKFEWVSNAKPEIENPELKNLSYDYYFPRWERELAYDKPIHGSVAKFPKKEREILKKQDIVSILIVPIIVHNKFWGFIGFDDCYKWRKWEKSEISMLSVLANSIGSTIERFRTEEQIKKELQTKQILIKEIHHRVKNNLQVISSILRMQSAYIHDPKDIELFKVSQSRVHSMALIHENIYNSHNLASVNFKHYLTVISNHLAKIYSVQASEIVFDIDIENIDFDINQAIPCGLIANELISNAIKYSFPDKEKGKIYIGFHQAGSSYQLTIADNGIGLPENISPATVKTLGLRLVHLLTKQLKGKMTIVRKKGTKFVLEFKHENYYGELE